MRPSVKTYAGILILLAGLAARLPAQSYRGLAAWEHIDALPVLRQGTSAHQVSSFERNGGNEDRNSWLYRDGLGDYVIFDDTGAGCIYRFWMTWGGDHPFYKANFASTHIKIYLDDDITPRFECSLADFFSGTVAPFLYPLAGNRFVSSGGYYAYVPIAYQTLCRISLTDMPPASMRDLPWGTESFWVYHNVNYHKYSSAADVVPWTGLEDYESVLDMLMHPGTDPKPSSQNLFFSGNLSVGSNDDVEVAHISGQGVLNSIEFTMPSLSMSQLNNLWLKIFWDDQVEAAVEVPFGQFFGSGYGETTVNGLLIGMNSGRYYCYFPMPFWQSFRLVLENKASGTVGTVAYALGVDTLAYDRDASGYFFARHAARSYTNGVAGSDFRMLEESGRGHYVGVTLSATGAGKIYGNGLAFLEGDERFYVDGSLTPQLHGTGNEDYFNGGWYYNAGTFSLPTHGSPVRSVAYGMNIETNYVGAYRLHIGDLVPFHSSISLGIEHGGANEVGCQLESVCYYYKQVDITNGLIPCLTIDVGDPLSEAASGYQVSGTSVVQSNALYYTGDDHDLVVLDEGRYLDGSSSFSVSIPPYNDGVLIRRRTDSGVGRQQAAVYVDNVYAGEWCFADTGYSNEVQRWADCDYYLPFMYTAGKSNLVLRFESADDTSSWNEYFYSIYAIRQMGINEDMDGDSIEDWWEGFYFSDLIACEGNDDSDGDGFTNRDEYISLTNPRDQDSVFAVYSDIERNEVLSFPTALARVYQVLYSSNLVADVWQELEEISGTGERYSIPFGNVTDNHGFYRVKVRLE